MKVKKRKKDLKSKYEPEDFCEALIDEIKEAEGNLDSISKKLDSAADPLDFKKYSEPLFDVLFAGGMIGKSPPLLPLPLPCPCPCPCPLSPLTFS